MSDRPEPDPVQPDPEADPVEEWAVAPAPDPGDQRTKELWDDLMRVVDRIPFIAGLKRDMKRLDELVVRRRAPRVLALGAPGSGRSQMLNGLVGAPVLELGTALGTWTTTDDRRVEWVELDTPEHTTDAPATKTRGRALVSERRPDALLLCVTPAQVRRGVGIQLDVLAALREAAQATDQGDVFVAVGLTHADALAAQPDQLDDPTVRACLTALRTQIEQAGLAVNQVFASRTPNPRDQRLGTSALGLEDVSRALMAAIPTNAKLEAARALVHVAAERRELAMEIVRCCSTLSVSIAITPLPLADMALLTPLQVLMVTALAYLSGRPWDRSTAGEWIVSTGAIGGAGFGLRWGAQRVASLVPGMGKILGAGIAGTGTLALGRAAIRYFLR